MRFFNRAAPGPSADSQIAFMMPRQQTALIVVLIATASYVTAASLRGPRKDFVEQPSPTVAQDSDDDKFVGAFYLGADACADCHDDKFETYKHTSHHQAMLVPGEDTLQGHFAPNDEEDKSEMKTRSEKLRYEMTEDDEGFYQTSIEERPQGVDRRTERIDLIMGSGKLAQSFFYRQGRALYQLPLVFFTPLDVWVNAPGYLDTWPKWTRGIEPRCLECHSTYFEEVPGSQNAYFTDTMVMRITCERCHGPGSKHVDYHDEHPDAKPKFIVNPDNLERQRHLEICSQCHGSIGNPVAASFHYVPGQPLNEYLQYSDDDDTMALVHTVNQLQRLEQSECFKHSSMTCIDCHDPHVHERDELQTFSDRCMKCHDVEHCGASQRLGNSIAENCIDCHMPLRDDSSTPFYLAAGDKLELLQLRDHLVAVHPEDSAEMEARWHDPQRDQNTKTRARLHAQEEIVGADLASAERAIVIMNYEEALIRLDRALNVDPTRDDVRLRLAWLLGSAPNASHRDGPRAVELVEAVSNSSTLEEWQRLDVLSVALAANGQFEEAAKMAIAAAETCPTVEKNEIESRAQLFRKKKPFRLDGPAGEVEKASPAGPVAP